MNFLQLAKRVRQECGISGDGPPSTSGQAGIYAKIVDWVNAAHEEVQQHHLDWNFDWARVTLDLADGVESYSPASTWGLDFKALSKDGLYTYRTVDGERAKFWLQEIAWEEYRQLRQVGVAGLPSYVALSPDKRLHFFPTPNAGLKFVMEYFREPQVLAANTDEPRMPARYHMAIVWRAVMMWCAHDENPALFQVANANYRELLRKLQVTELPGMRTAGGLA